MDDLRRRAKLALLILIDEITRQLRSGLEGIMKMGREGEAGNLGAAP